MQRRTTFFSLVWLVSVLCAFAIASEPEHREIISNGIGYRKVPVGTTGVQFPKLTRYRDQAILKDVNQKIDTLTSTMRCENSAEENTYQVKSSVTYAAKDIFSIYASASYYCGGPYPTNDSNVSLTFDLKTGTVVSFQNLFRDYEADKKDILRTIFSKQVARAEQLATERGKATQRNNGDRSCENDPALFSLEHLKQSDFAFNLSKEGLQVQPQWPHVIEACAKRVSVPFHTLQRFAKPDGILARAIAL